MGQQAGPGHAAGDRPVGRGGLRHALAAPAGGLGPGDLDDLQPGGDQVEKLAHVLAHDPQIAAAVGAGRAGLEHAALARRALGHSRATTGLWSIGWGVGIEARVGEDAAISLGLVQLGRVAFGRGDLQILERQLELRDLALDLPGAETEALPLDLRDPCPQRRRSAGRGRAASPPGGRSPASAGRSRPSARRSSRAARKGRMSGRRTWPRPPVRGLQGQ